MTIKRRLIKLEEAARLEKMRSDSLLHLALEVNDGWELSDGRILDDAAVKVWAGKVGTRSAPVILIDR